MNTNENDKALETAKTVGKVGPYVLLGISLLFAGWVWSLPSAEQKIMTKTYTKAVSEVNYWQDVFEAYGVKYGGVVGAGAAASTQCDDVVKSVNAMNRAKEKLTDKEYREWLKDHPNATQNIEKMNKRKQFCQEEGLELARAWQENKHRY